MVGESVGSYRIERKIGEGGMGAVYLGQHKRIPRKAAIKVLLSEFSTNHDLVERFFTEARATALIKHPGIVDITDCDLLPNGSAYIVMEYLEGESLGSRLRHGEALSPSRAAFLVRNVAHALAAAHDKGIVHRDLKPDNIFLPNATVTGEYPTKILDFGIAKLLNPETGLSNRKTRTGSIMGTPVYMSPEQCRGVGTIDHRTDVYSLGCVFFEILCGRPPFVSEGFGELIQSHLSVTAPAVRSMSPSVPPAIDALVARMLAKAPADRPQTMRDVIAELDAATLDAASPAAAAVTPSMAPPAGGAGAPPARADREGPVAMPRVQTTLRSASAERLASGTEADLVVPKARRTGLFVGVGVSIIFVAAVVALRGGASSPSPRAASSAPPHPPPAALAAKPPSTTNAAPSSVTSPPSTPTAAVTSTLSVTPKPAAAPQPADQSPAAATRPSTPIAEPRKASKVASAPHKVTVSISSDPPGADVCLAGDRVLLGKTKFVWTTERGPREIKLLVRKTNYRGKDITFRPDGDLTKRVELEKLGPDDIAEAGCRPR